jgi:hypothetical protein
MRVPEKSAEPTPTMMMDIGWDDAATMAACGGARRGGKGTVRK